LIPKDIVSTLQEQGFQINVLQGDIQAAIDAETERLTTLLQQQQERNTAGIDTTQDASDFFSDFQTYDSIVAWASQLQSNGSSGLLGTASPNVNYTASIGKSTEGRDIFSLSITGGIESTLTKQWVFIQALLHAREWIATSTALYFCNYLITNYASDPNLQTLLDKLVFVVVPVANPDGYIYSWETDRLWRKNRSNNTDGTFGVDLNRNFPSHWGLDSGSSGATSDDDYRGPSAGSELETQVSMQLLYSLPNLVAAIDLHSFSQVILRPPSWEQATDPNEATLSSMSDGMVSHIASSRGTKYASEQAYKLYLSSGDAMTWWHDQSSSMISLTIELEPQANTLSDGFILSPSEIVPVGMELTKGLVYVSERTAGLPITGSQAASLAEPPSVLVMVIMGMTIWLTYDN